MMTHALERGVAEGYAVAALTASEGTIYRRFGFGCAIRERDVIVSARARAPPARADVRHGVGRHAAVSRRRPRKSVFDRFHERSIGSMVRNTGSWPFVLGLLGHDGQNRRKTSAPRCTVPSGPTRSTATSPGASRSRPRFRPASRSSTWSTRTTGLHALWEFLLSVDLNDVVKYNRARLDDPIVAALGDNRAYDVDHEEDHVWLRVLDLPPSSPRGRSRSTAR